MRALAATLASQHGLDPVWVEQQLGLARYQPTVARLMMPPATPAARNWGAYRARLVDRPRIQAGAAFWARHADALARAEATYGVPASLIVGIIGVETFYGRVTGNFRVLDALTTLALDFPRGRSDRTPYFRSELGEYLAWCRREGRDPTTTLGSYAGAIGLGQFMPGSIARFAIDFDGDGAIDMAGNPVDVIGSVAHYLARHGWKTGQPTHFAVQPPADPLALARLLGPDIKPTFRAADMAAEGAVLEPAAAAHDGLLALVELRNGEQPSSWIAGTENFWVVTRYNWSAMYALAVIELGRAAAATRGGN